MGMKILRRRTFRYSDILKNFCKIECRYSFCYVSDHIRKFVEMYQTVDLDYVHTMPAHFENGEKCDG